MRTLFLIATAICCCYLPCFAQDGSNGVAVPANKGIAGISDKSLSFMQHKYSRLTTSIQQQSTKMLQRMQRKEQKLRNKLQRKDSTLAKELFEGSESKYKQLQSSLTSKADTSLAHPLQEYIPNIDSLQTALSFLKQGNALQNLSADKLQQVNKATGQLKELQASMQQANNIQAYIRGRQQELKQQLKDKLLNSSIAKQFKSINKEAFYYEQRLREYKELINDKQKLEQKALELVRNLPAFQSFWQKHSYLAQLFPTPANYGTPQALAGLQTRAAVQQQLQQRFGMSSFTPNSSGGGASNNYLQQQMQAAQTQLSQLKDKLSNLGINGGSSDMTMPEFKPNSQHTKSFLKRIEYGVNIQSQKSTWGIPVTSDIALTAGYKLNDKSTIGIGAAYRIGWGNGGLKHIKITHEGVGLRSYVDIKAKGSIWLSGGYELNYMQSFRKFADLYDINVWQRSGLIGITKKYKVGKHENNMQLLWDFLSYNQMPKTPAIKFRVGFKL
ncbi:hypothetical protein FC093_22670 [Ilyomonas limi]|uniref:Uncharacterized protein n=1 Tax=Ilyomonas limi TaxID=2575867 RepID=A0A4U3KQ77_9BACT|nr:hypothetical protein [Ilyomonas limi]TKK64360.1 hypothetical protein FC093_22670 [Ilyomonas limi]